MFSVQGMMHKIFIVMLALFFIASMAVAQVGYVDGALSTGANDGSSWADAYQDMSTALTNASGAGYTELWVAAGTYALVDGLMPGGLAVYGGFTSGDTARGDRDWENNVTTLESDGSARVIRMLANDRLDGFTITGGDAAGSSYTSNYGGGVLIYYASGAVLENCTISTNTAQFGGGIAIRNTVQDNPNPEQIINCTISNNVMNVADGYGAGMSILEKGYCEITSTTFENNSMSAAAVWNVGGGGAVAQYSWSNGPANVQYTACQFINNSATHDGGAITVFSNNATLTNSIVLDGCLFSGNSTTESGGAIRMRGPGVGTIRDCQFLGNTATGTDKFGGAIYTLISGRSVDIENSVFAGNRSDDFGAAIYMNDGTADGSIVNCTFDDNVANNATTHGMIDLRTGTALTIANCIFSNTTNRGVSMITSASVEPVLTNNLFYAVGNWDVFFSGAGYTGTNINGIATASGNLAGNPNYVGGGDYHIQSPSYAVANGDSASAPAADIDGTARPLPVGSNPDIGAYEETTQDAPLGVIGTVGYVTVSGAGDGSGRDWANAYAGLGAALTDQNGTPFFTYDALWVAQGTHPVVDQIVPSGMEIYGGFVGTETARTERDWETNVTTLESDGAARVIRLVADSRLDGFTVTGGDAAGSSYTPNYGGGVMMYYASGAVLENCTISTNTAQFGGGIAIRNNVEDNPNPEQIINCTISNNVMNVADGYGAGMSILEKGYCEITSTTFENNSMSATAFWKAGGGGAVAQYSWSNGPANVQYTACQFINNSATYDGGAITVLSDNATLENSLVLDGCLFSGNSTTESGGAIRLRGPGVGTIRDCQFLGNTATGTDKVGGAIYTLVAGRSVDIENSVFAGNRSDDFGAAIYLNDGTADGSILNCTFDDNVANNATTHGMIDLRTGTALTIANCIFSNTANRGVSMITSASVEPVLTNNLFYEVSNWDVFFSGAGYTGANINDIATASGNLAGNPNYVGGGDYHLQWPSFAVANGDGASAPVADIEGTARPLPVGSNPDIGAYEETTQDAPLGAAGTVGYVTVSGAGDGTGRDWANAYAGLGAALTDQNGTPFFTYDALWVAQGTHPVVDQTVPSGMEIYGGFVGTETARTERDWETNVTTLESDGSARVIRLLADNHLDGFTITGGDAAGSSFTPNYGGGVLMFYASGATLENCKVSGNSGQFGGGIAIRNNVDSNPNPEIITNCVIESNVMNVTDGSGAGLYMMEKPFTEVTSTTFLNNTQTAAAFWSQGGGGAVTQNTWSSGASHTKFTDCHFENNSATNEGGAISVYAATNGVAADITIVDCVFTGNSTTENGGALRLRGTGRGTIRNSIFSGNTATGTGKYGGAITTLVNDREVDIENCLFYDNAADDFGAAIYMQDNATNGRIVNCTFADNSIVTNPSSRGQIDLRQGTALTIANCIFYNVDTRGVNEVTSVSVDPTMKNNLFFLVSSWDLFHDGAGYSGLSINGLALGTDNKAGNPNFIGGTNYRLNAESAAVASGDATEAPATDIVGTARPLPVGTPPDIGAYEEATATSPVNVGLVAYVTVTGSGLKDGTSWANAYEGVANALADVQAGTSLKPYNEFWVAGGSYSLVDAILDPDMQLYGGFTSGDASRADADPVANTTILQSDGSARVLEMAPNTVLHGFTVQNGDALGSSNQGDYGGGILMWYDSGAVVSSCTIFNNSAKIGGGIAIRNNAGDYTNPEQVLDCVITSNSMNVASGHGGGLALYERPGAIIEGTTFSDNTMTAAADFKAGGGGAVSVSWSTGSGQAQFIDCDFLDNYSSGPGGGFALVANHETTTNSVELIRCRFERNIADDNGGGAHFRGPGETIVSQSYFLDNEANGDPEGKGGAIHVATSRNMYVSNSVLSGNQAQNDGGAIELFNFGEVWLTNCTLDNNSCVKVNNYGGGINVGDGQSLRIENSIFSNNADWAINEFDDSANDPILRNNLFFENPRGLYYNYEDAPTGDLDLASLNGLSTASGNLSGDPKYAGASDYEILEGSAAQGAGVSTDITPSVDILGRDRGAAVDVGAYTAIVSTAIEVWWVLMH